MGYEAIVMGVSAGGWQVLNRILPRLPGDFRVPVIIVQHMAAISEDFLARRLDKQSALTVREAEDKEVIRPGTIYLAPANYHLQVEIERTLSLSIDEPINYARPSIDILFMAAAAAYRSKLIGVLLTGASSDGSLGLQEIKRKGGLTIVQDPVTAEAETMPQSAIDLFEVDQILALDEIVPFLVKTLSEAF